MTSAQGGDGQVAGVADGGEAGHVVPLDGAVSAACRVAMSGMSMLSTSMPSSASSGASSRSVCSARPGVSWILRRSRRWFGAAAAHVGHEPHPAAGHRRCRQAASGGCLQRRGQQGSRGVPAEGLARPVVELGGDRGQLPGGVDAQVGALGEVLAQQPVGVLVRRPLPGRVRIAEEHRHAQRPR